MRFLRPASALAAVLLTLPLLASEPLAIQDNSFLIEEAYNQEKGVVQHIFTFSRARDGSFIGTFTQEWPAGGIKNQLSYTIPVERQNSQQGIGDTLLNYRYQLIGDGTSRLAIAPRLSLILPSGNERRGLGAGGYGFDINLPLSFALSDRVVTHWNAGATRTPSSSTPTAWSAGASIIAAPFEKFHMMLETRWTHDRDSTVVVAPGVRWAWDLKSGLQIVPGVAVPIGSDHSRSLYFYLSLEHPFARR